MSAHVPVLLERVMEALGPKSGEVIVDGTFGAGGYAKALLEAGAKVIAFDRDPTAIAAGTERFADQQDQLTLIEAPFDQLAQVLAARNITQVDGIVFDFGVSSMQLDQAGRGFSFMVDGPLDMRMGAGATAADVVNQLDEADLADVIYQYGEERRSRHLARLIVAARQEKPFERTQELATLAEKALGKGQKIHPATRLFQGIRIFVNDELGQIVRALLACEPLLKPGGRLAAVSFHSLEDRIVKRFLAEVTGRQAGGSRHLPEVQGPQATFDLIGKAVRASDDEVDQNPRARSATLRTAIRNDHPASQWTDKRLTGLGVPSLVFSPLQSRWSQS